jgi:hypothetical protein
VGLSFCLALVTVPLTSALARAQTDAKITVRVYNYAQVPGGALARAEAEAQRILSAAGVDSVWLDCWQPPSQFQSSANHDCSGPLSGATVAVRILPGSTKGEVFSRDSDLGFAAGGGLASVFYGRITNFAKGGNGKDSDIPVILGDAITHELGHLLLGPGAHSPTGIMCGHWDRDYLRLALRGRQLFTPQQSALLQANVLRRQ